MCSPWQKGFLRSTKDRSRTLDNTFGKVEDESLVDTPPAMLAEVEAVTLARHWAM